MNQPTANLRIYGGLTSDGEQLASPHILDIGTIEADEQGDGTFWVLLPINSLAPDEQSSAVDVLMTRDDLRALIERLELVEQELTLPEQRRFRLGRLIRSSHGPHGRV